MAMDIANIDEHYSEINNAKPYIITGICMICIYYLHVCIRHICVVLLHVYSPAAVSQWPISAYVRWFIYGYIWP